MAFNYWSVFVHLCILVQLATAAPTSGSPSAAPITSTISPEPSAPPGFNPSLPTNFTTLDIAIYPRGFRLNTTLCNATQTPEIRTVSYHIVEGWAIIDGDVIFGTEAEILAAAVPPSALMPRSPNSLTRRSMGLYPQSGGKWPSGVIYYKWGSGMDDIRKEAFLGGAKFWSDRLPFLHFIEKPANDPTARTIGGITGLTSYSSLGYTGGGGVILIGDNHFFNVAAHEIGHTLGLMHEHQRPDRDWFINIDCNEIGEPKDCTPPWTGNANPFWIEPASAWDWAGSYDLNSIMHYDAFGSARSTTKPVITGKPPITFNNGGRAEPTLQDARHVCELYWEDCHSICGDGILSPQFEECDDGNNINGDGCSSDCRVEPQPSACLPTCVPGACGGRATCEVFNPLTPAPHSGESHCVCQAGYRATGVAPTNTSLQYHLTWKNANGDQTHRVFVKPGQDCYDVCSDVNCSEVPLKDSCR